MWTDWVMKIINKLRPQRSDALGREHGQAVVRLVLSLVAEAYLVFSHIPLDFSHGIPDWLLLSLGFVLFSVMIVIASQRADESVWWRLLIDNIADVGIVTIGLATLGEVGIPLFVLYLWATLGNGIHNRSILNKRHKTWVQSWGIGRRVSTRAHNSRIFMGLDR